MGGDCRTPRSEGGARDAPLIVCLQGVKFRTTMHKLRCVRPFRIADVSLSADSEIDPDAADVDLQVQEFLAKQARCVWRLESCTGLQTAPAAVQVEALIREAGDLLEAMPEEERPPPNLRLPLVSRPPLLLRAPRALRTIRSRCLPTTPPIPPPQIRVRVEHSGYKSLAVQRFGTTFVGRVANPADILLLWRKPRSGGGRAAGGAEAPVAPKGLPVAASAVPSGILVSDLIRTEL